MLADSPIADIATNLQFGTNATGISADSMYRHRRRHLYPSLSGPIGDVDLTTLSLWGHMESALNDTARVSERATATGSPSLLLKASQVRAGIVREILDRLPKDEQLDLLHSLHDAEGFINALIRLTTRDPQLGLAIADQLDEDGTAPALRDSFRAYASGALALEAKKEN
jgi:hypothetical protein